METKATIDRTNSTWNCFAVKPGATESVPFLREKVPGLVEEGYHVWVDIEAQTEADAMWLGEVFDLHELALSDLLNNEVRPKQESYGPVLFTVFSAINLNEGEDQLDTINLNIFLTERIIVSVHYKPLKTVAHLLHLMEKPRDPLVRGVDYVFHGLLDGVIDRYLDVIDEVDESVDAIECKVFDSPTRDIQEEIFREKRRLAFLRRSIGPKRDALRDLVYLEFPQIRPEVRTLLRDVQDHVLRVADSIESYKELTSGLMESYMSNLSQRMNEVMKLMSIIATIMLPLSFLAGVFGMNFEQMPGIHMQYGFWVLMGAMAVLVAVMMWLFRRSGIL